MPCILVGTTPWTDKTLITCGRFYPPEVKSAEERLRYYATRFPIVEVDSSYYALPSAQNAELWGQRTPAGFVFDVKAFRLFTQHQTAPRALPADIRRSLGERQTQNLYYRDVPEGGSSLGCGLAMPHIQVGANPTLVTASRGPGIEPCRRAGNNTLDA